MDLRNQIATSEIVERLDREFPAGGSVSVEDSALNGNSSRIPSAVPPLGNGAAIDDERRRSANGRRFNEVESAATFLDAALNELAWQIEHDNRCVALLPEEMLRRFPARHAPSPRLQMSPDPGRPDDVARAIDWCRRLADSGRRLMFVLTRASLPGLFGQFRDKLCLRSLPVQFLVVPDSTEINGNDTAVAAARGSSSLAFLRLLPNTVVALPKDGWELRQLVRLATAQQGPMAIQLPDGRLPAPGFPDFVEDLGLGQAEILEEGVEIALLAVGALVSPAVKAAELLSRQGISAGVVNARFVEPLDRPLICDVAAQVRGLLTLEEESAAGGFGSAVLELLADSGISTPVTVSGAVGLYTSGADCDRLVDRIVHQALSLVDRTNGTTRVVPKAVRKMHRKPRQNGVDLFGFSNDSLQREHDLVKSRQLSREVEDWYAVYSLVGERQRFLWQWCEQGAELTTLPCVPPERFTHVCQTKVLSIMLCVLLDDVADQRDREAFLEVLLKIVDGQAAPDLSACTDEERYYAEVTRRLAEIYLARVRSYPCFQMFDRLLRYDQLQYFNTMRYSQMLNHNLWLLNPIEHDLYQPHNMDMMSFATLDLMCAPDFPTEELGRLREAVWHLQCMARVGNLLSTWRREIGQQDYTSGVFARAVVEGDLSVRQLRPDNFGEIETAIVEGGHERYYFGRWKYHRECFLARARDVYAIDLQKLLNGSDRFFVMHLGGRGLI